MVKLSVCIEMIFRELDVAERIAKVAQTGLDAIEFWGAEPEKVQAIGAACQEHGVAVASFVCGGPPLVEAGSLAERVKETAEACKLAGQLGTKTLIVTTGQELEGVCRTEQHNNIVKILKAMAPVAADAGVRLALEPLNTTVNHAGYYLATSREGFEICAEVDHPAVGLLYDIYHMQIMEGNLTDVITENAGRIHHFHVADVPGRHEPGSGEIHYPHLFGVIDQLDYDGYVGLEYAPTADHAASLKQVMGMCP
jgi:hydroxypyruvate isomerase